VTTNLIGRLTIVDPSLRMTNHPSKDAWLGSRDPFLNFGSPSMSLEWVKLGT